MRGYIVNLSPVAEFLVEILGRDGFVAICMVIVNLSPCGPIFGYID